MNSLQSLRNSANLVIQNHHQMEGCEVFREIDKIKAEFELWTESLDDLVTDDWDLLEKLDATREDFLKIIDQLDDTCEVRDTSRPTLL